MNISIVVPYPNAEQWVKFWAIDENRIDFRHDFEAATRCTLSFAAMELFHFLTRSLEDCTLAITSQAIDGHYNIRLNVTESSSRNERFRLIPEPQGLTITGQGRTGTLYGVYEFLRMQGWRWFSPGLSGEIAPSVRKSLLLPQGIKEFTPSLNFGRGFDFEGISKESSQLLLWMARNRLNVCGYRPNTFALGNKLGMQFKVGGHIFEEILNPDRILPSGKTLWEAHEEWYGLPEGHQREKKNALTTQFCVSRPDLRLFLAEELLSKLMSEFSGVDRLDIWGFDTWGGNCTCPDCLALGNGADQILFLASFLRDFLDHAQTKGKLDHPVQLVTCAYEGTSTLQSPQHPIPRNLTTSGDYVVFYPINRCYAHDINDKICTVNLSYDETLRGWLEKKPGIPVTVGEYYNVSKFEDLPLLFTSRIKNDLPCYAKYGTTGITYMHVPMFNWAMRALTQNIYAQLAWDIHTDVSRFIADYFEKWYGPYANDLQLVYGKIEEAWLLIADWRAWAPRSVLSQLLLWNGRRPDAPLKMDNHFGNSSHVIESGRRSVTLLKEAMAILELARKKDQQTFVPTSEKEIAAVAVNPNEIRLLSTKWHEWRLGEDRRLLQYGIDTMILMTEVVAYHNALYLGEDEQARFIWETVEQTANVLDSYYVPIEFESSEADLISKDALTRTQLREVIRHCRQYQNEIQNQSKVSTKKEYPCWDNNLTNTSRFSCQFESSPK